MSSQQPSYSPQAGAVEPNTLPYRIARAIDALRGVSYDGHQPSTADQPPKGQVDADAILALAGEWQELFRLKYSRLSRYQEYESMDVGDTASLLDAIRDACLISDEGQQYSFKVETPDNKKYQGVIDQILEASSLQDEVFEMLRNMLKYGDEFVYPIFDEYMRIVFVESNVPAAQMRVNTDRHNRVLAGVMRDKEGRPTDTPAAYHQVTENDKIVAAWYDWEMFHLKYMPSRKHRYSRCSFLESFRRDWHSLTWMEQSMVIARLVRAYLRQVHYIDTTGQTLKEATDTLKTYRENYERQKLADERMRRQPLQVDTDLYISTGHREGPDGRLYDKQTKVEVIDPRNTGLRAIPDVEYFRGKQFTRVSSEIVGVQKDREEITQQDVAASRLYQYLARQLTKQLILPVLLLGLRLQGYRPEPGERIQVQFPSAVIKGSWKYADAYFRLSMADTNYIEAGVTNRRQVARQRYGMDEREWQEHEQQRDREKERFGDIDRGTTAQQRRIGQASA